jgi:hypothetical protein
MELAGRKAMPGLKPGFHRGGLRPPLKPGAKPPVGGGSGAAAAKQQQAQQQTEADGGRPRPAARPGKGGGKGGVAAPVARRTVEPGVVIEGPEYEKQREKAREQQWEDEWWRQWQKAEKARQARLAKEHADKEAQLSKRYNHTLTRQLVQSLAQDGYLVVTWANHHYTDFALSWVYHVQKVRRGLRGEAGEAAAGPQRVGGGMSVGGCRQVCGAAGCGLRAGRGEAGC